MKPEDKVAAIEKFVSQKLDEVVAFGNRVPVLSDMRDRAEAARDALAEVKYFMERMK